jgi:hypothetical protein
LSPASPKKRGIGDRVHQGKKGHKGFIVPSFQEKVRGHPEHRTADVGDNKTPQQ